MIKKLLLIILIGSFPPSLAYAQEPILTPTPTPNVTPTVCVWGGCEIVTPDPGIITPTPPTFGEDPNYASPPTSIPDIEIPDFNAPNTPTIIEITLPTVDLPETPVPGLQPIGASIGLSYSTPAPLQGDGTYLTITNTISGTFTGIHSQVLAISDSTYILLNGTDNFSAVLTASTVPSWYAPYLPRDVAQVGWDFETLGADVRRRYSVSDWFEYIGNLSSLPIRFIKGLAELFALSGPLMLFLVWLLIFGPLVLVVRLVRMLWPWLVWFYKRIWELWEAIPWLN